MKTSRSLLSRLFLGMTIAVVLYAVLAAVAGFGNLRGHFQRFPWAYFIPLAGLSLFNYSLRYWRWHLYLKRLHVVISLKESMSIFFATFVMVITPGKLGEAFKAGLLWEKHQVPLATGLPVVIAERLLDFLAVFVLACLGLLFWRGPVSGLTTALLVAGLLPLLLLGIRSRRLRGWLLKRAARAPTLKRFSLGLTDATESLSRLLSGRVLLGTLLLSLLAWASECISLWLVCKGMSASLPVLEALFVYAAGTLVGSLTFLPGGLGGTEGTLIWLLSERGIGTDISVSIALIVRIVTLWLAVLIGLLVLLAKRRSFWCGPDSDRPPERNS